MNENGGKRFVQFRVVIRNHGVKLVDPTVSLVYSPSLNSVMDFGLQERVEKEDAQRYWSAG